GNAASVTSSNGEGSSYVVPGTQIMMNNMLGEEDLNPNGFNQWPLNQRMSSMMAPTMILREGKPELVLGSGGSNRIRTAILQVISNILDFDMSLAAAVNASRIHWENGVLHLEPGLSEPGLSEPEPGIASATVEPLGEPLGVESLGTDQVVIWQRSNMFFGGVHAVSSIAGELNGAGDPRRSGSVS
ncbi:MAG: gamma-glutamyltransferase, partial [Phormidesmis sp.]